VVVVMVQLEAAVLVAVPAVAAVVASWLLVEDKMYFLLALAVRTSADGSRMFMEKEGGRGRGRGGGR